MLKTQFDPDRQLYMARFFLKFGPGESVATVKLLDEYKNPRKFYKVAISSDNKVCPISHPRTLPPSQLQLLLAGLHL